MGQTLKIKIILFPSYSGTMLLYLVPISLFFFYLFEAKHRDKVTSLILHVSLKYHY